MTATTLFSSDDYGNTIPVLPYRAAGGHAIAAGAASELVGPFPDGTRMVTMRAVGGDVFWAAGDETIAVAVAPPPYSAGAHYLRDGETIDVALGGPSIGPAIATHIAVIAATGAPKVYISERG